MGIAAASVMLGWWAVGLEPFSPEATAMVLGAGVLAIAAGRATGRPSPAHHVPLRSVAPWLVVAAVLALLQLLTYLQQPRSDHPTLSSLANEALDPRPIRAVAFAAWLAVAGWLARG